VEFEGRWDFPREGLYNTATKFKVECTYSNGIKLVLTDEGRGGTTFVGSEGTMYVGDGEIETDPPHLAHSVIGPNEIRLYDSRDHHQYFLDCIKTRKDPIAPIEVAHRAVTIGHIGNMAMLLERKLRWDPDAEQFIDDSDADRMLSRAMRAPWHL
jgi:hypothetical protein